LRVPDCVHTTVLLLEKILTPNKLFGICAVPA
jgi:hypothetical protein